MASLKLLPELLKLPADDAVSGLDYGSLSHRFLKMDRDHWSIETSAGVEETLLGIFEARNVPDDLQHAHSASFTDSDLSLHEHYIRILGRGDQAVIGFVSNLKGKVAELRQIADLEERYPGYSFSIAEDPTQPVWDIRGEGPEGAEDIFVQVKVGAESYAPEVVRDIQAAPENVFFAMSREIHERIAETHPQLVNRLIPTGMLNLEFTEGIEDNLKVLAQNSGIDVPDKIGDMLPYASEVVLGIRLLLDIRAVEKDFKGVELTDRQRIRAMRALTLLSRFGVTSILVQLGATAGSLAPGLGTILGSITGAAAAAYLNRRLKPKMLEVAMKVAGVDGDDLFYLRNKVCIDGIGASLAATKVA